MRLSSTELIVEIDEAHSADQYMVGNGLAQFTVMRTIFLFGHVKIVICVEMLFGELTPELIILPAKRCHAIGTICLTCEPASVYITTIFAEVSLTMDGIYHVVDPVGSQDSRLSVKSCMRR